MVSQRKVAPSFVAVGSLSKVVKMSCSDELSKEHLSGDLEAVPEGNYGG